MCARVSVNVNLNILHHGPLKEEMIGVQEQSVLSLGCARVVKTLRSEHKRTHTHTHTYIQSSSEGQNSVFKLKKAFLQVKVFQTFRSQGLYQGSFLGNFG